MVTNKRMAKKIKELLGRVRGKDVKVVMSQ
jgi:hypothetical protein